jgi:GNAT superfamily N-acetyltransferase
VNYRIERFSDTHIDAALSLLSEVYRSERRCSPNLPDLSSECLNRVRSSLKETLNYPGVAVFSESQLAAYMATADQFSWKGQHASLVREYGHAAECSDKERLYQIMYMHLAEQWMASGSNLHLMGHFSHDSVLTNTLYALGYGAILSEELRDLSSITFSEEIPVVRTEDPVKLLELQLEHNRYYDGSPIFIKKNDDPERELAELCKHKEQNDIFLVWQVQGEPVGYFIIGTSDTADEGFLLQYTNTLQIKSAYIKPEYRGQGGGSALLREAVSWGKQTGFSRILVEHETANFYGGRFWNKHFEPYLIYSMRYTEKIV